MTVRVGQRRSTAYAGVRARLAGVIQEHSGVPLHGVFFQPGPAAAPVNGSLILRQGAVATLTARGVVIPFTSIRRLTPNTLVEEPIDQLTPSVILGRLDDDVPVTLFDARYTQVVSNGGGVVQEISCPLVILGGHFSDPRPLFAAVRVSVQGINPLRSWLGAESSLRSELADGSMLALYENEAQGVWVEHNGEPASVAVWTRDLLQPLRSLIALLTNHAVHPTVLEVRTSPQAPWMPVWLSSLQPEDHAVARLVSAVDGFGWRNIVHWIGNVERLAALPAVVVGGDSDVINIETRVLELSTVAEGLHRVLNPEAWALSRSVADQARRQARAAITNPEAREKASGLLKFLHEPGYRKRLLELGEQAQMCVPDLLGDARLWSRAVFEARNEYAHRHQTAWLTDADISKLTDIYYSLTWVLTIVLRQMAGFDDDQIHRQFRQDSSYRLLRRQVRTWQTTAVSHSSKSDEVNG